MFTDPSLNNPYVADHSVTNGQAVGIGYDPVAENRVQAITSQPQLFYSLLQIEETVGHRIHKLFKDSTSYGTSSKIPQFPK